MTICINDKTFLSTQIQTGSKQTKNAIRIAQQRRQKSSLIQIDIKQIDINQEKKKKRP